jgi:hypothetical protein
VLHDKRFLTAAEKKGERKGLDENSWDGDDSKYWKRMTERFLTGPNLVIFWGSMNVRAVKEKK